MKTIFYVLSVLIIGASAYFSWDNSSKIQAEIDSFEDTRNKKRTVDGTIDKTEETLKETEDDVEAAKKVKSDLESEEKLADIKKNDLNGRLSKANTKIRTSDAELTKFDVAMEKIKDALKGINVPWDQIDDKIAELEEDKKKKEDDRDQLTRLTQKLAAEVESKEAQNAAQGVKLAKIKRKIGLNARVGQVTSVNMTWGFVVVNFGTDNSNIEADSKLLVTRNGRVIARLVPDKVESQQSVCDLNARDVVAGVRIQRGDKVTLADSVGN